MSTTTTTATHMSANGAAMANEASVRKRMEDMDLVSTGEYIFRGMSRDKVWQIVADTDLFSRAAGKEDATVIYDHERGGQPLRGRTLGTGGAFQLTPRREVAFRFRGDHLSYSEEPFEWDVNAGWWFCARELPEDAPGTRVIYFTKLHDAETEMETEKTDAAATPAYKVEFVAGIKARDSPVTAETMQTLEEMMETAAIHKISHDSLTAWSQNQQLSAFAQGKSATNNVKLEVAKRSLNDLGEDAHVVGQLVDHLQHGLDADVTEMQPKKMARRWGITNSDAVVNCFLRAGRIGLLEPKWSFVCPACRGSKSGQKQLFNLPQTAHCVDCGIDMDSDPRQTLQLVFGVGKNVRGDSDQEIAVTRACAGSPILTPHRWAQAHIDPGQSRVVVQDVSTLPGTQVKLRCPNVNAETVIEKADAAGVWTLNLDGGENGHTTTTPAQFTKLQKTSIVEGLDESALVVENVSSEHSLMVLLEEANPIRRDALMAQEVLDNPGFANMFGAEEWEFLSTMAGAVKEEKQMMMMSSSSPNLMRDDAADATICPLTQFDIAVVGSGPAGESLALASSRLGAKVALIEKSEVFGGPTGLGSKAFREAALKVLSWARMNESRPNSATLKETFNKRFGTFLQYAVTLVSHELMCRLGAAGVTLVRGFGKLEKDGLTVTRPDGNVGQIRSSNVALCVGSHPARPPNVPFDGISVLDGEEISKIASLPDSIAIIGGGIIAMEYASIFGCLGVQTHVINSHAGFLPMLERGLCDELVSSMESEGVVLHREVKVKSWSGGKGEPVTVELSNGKSLTVDMVLYGQGREGSTGDVASEGIELNFGKYGFLSKKDDYSVGPDGVYAIGDVVGGGVASTAADHGEALAHNLFGGAETSTSTPGPLVLWTIPEVASAGMSRQQAEAKDIEVITARADYREQPRGLLTGCLNGYLEMVVEKDGGKILGVHIFGPASSELVHFGATLIANQKTVNQLVRQMFAAVTLHCLFHIAAERAAEQLVGSPVSSTTITTTTETEIKAL